MTEHSEGYVYVLLFMNGVVKVGRTTKPTARINSHRYNGDAHGNPLTNYWVSKKLVNMEEAEHQLIAYCQDRGTPVAGKEWFRAISYMELVDFASGITTAFEDPDGVTSYEIDRAVAFLTRLGYTVHRPVERSITDVASYFVRDKDSKIQSSEGYRLYKDAGGVLTQKDWLAALERELKAKRKRTNKGTVLVGISWKPADSPLAPLGETCYTCRTR